MKKSIDPTTARFHAMPIAVCTISTVVRQRGMTLLELSVVLLILVALSGLVVPFVSGYWENARTSSAAASLSDLHRAIDEYQNRYARYPNNLDSLVTASGQIITWLSGARGIAPPELTLVDLASDTGILNALQNTGSHLTTLREMPDGIPGVDFNASFPDPSSNFNVRIFPSKPLGNGTGQLSKLVRITSAPLTDYPHSGTSASPVQILIEEGMGIEVPASDKTATPTHYYLVFGIGQNTALTGSVLKEAPIYFASAVDNPINVYSRYLAVFRAPVNGTGRVVFIGTLTPDLRPQSWVARDYFRSVQHQ